MAFTRYRKTLAAWLALFALALNVAWPLIAKAAPAASPGLSDICTAVGVQSAAGGTGHGTGVEFAASHCAFCSFGSAKAIFAPRAGEPPVPPKASVAPAGVDIRLPAGTSRHTPAAPRAPPSFS